VELAADATWIGYSLAERDRRWRAVRENAARAGLDCIFVPLTVDPDNLYLSSDSRRGVRSDCRYLTQMANAAVVLPTDGRDPVVVNDRGTGNAWIRDARPASRGMRGSWSEAMADVLIALGMERARIGVSGLKGGKVTHTRAFNGVVNYSSYADIVARLPNATFEDATDVIGFARYIRGDEEIAAFRRAVAIAEAGVETLARVARPGVDQAELYAQVTVRMLELGSEHHNWAMNIGPVNGRRPRATEPPIGKRLQPGDYITNEVSAVWGGQLAQEDQPILLAPVPDAWKPVIEVQRAVWEEGLKVLKPGTAFAEVIDFVKGFGPKHRMKTGLTMHGRGLGNEGPIITPRLSGESIRDVRVEKNTTFVWKPQASTLDDSITFSWGGDVLVGENGAEKLFARPHGVIAIS
jgi:Xaa-Pro aminopeptidase